MFKKLNEFFKKAFSRKKKQDEWASRFTNPPASGSNNLPLDPSKDPWTT